jgi:tungstate transport system substrate-binding protein
MLDAVILRSQELLRRPYMTRNGDPISRRKFLKLATTAIAAGPAILTGTESALAAASAGMAGKNSKKAAAADPRLVRVASVSTAVEGGLLPVLIKQFRAETGLKVDLTRDDDLYGPAREGKFDLAISHFGHRDVESFILNGFGQWPRTVFSNQVGLFGPPSDPAKVRGLPSLVQAFRQIAQAKAPYVMNETHGLRYLTEIAWHAAGKPPKSPWFINPGVNKKDAILLAAERGAYVMWGLTPFLREQKAARGRLVPLVTADPILQRIMVSIVVNPERVPGVNASGASRFQEYLLLPATQAKILETHYPDIKQATWAPAGRHNAGSALPD